MVTPSLAQPYLVNHHHAGGSGKSEGGDGASHHFGVGGVGVAAGRSAEGDIVHTGGLAGGASDEAPPTIQNPGNLTVPTDGDEDDCSGLVEFPAINVTDNRDRRPRVEVTLLTDPTEDLDPGGEDMRLGRGSYDVRIVATDRYGNRAQAAYRVDVVDRTPPSFDPRPDPTPADEPAEAASPLGTRVDVNVNCVDLCDDSPQAGLDPNRVRYPVGDTELRASCEDESGNEANHDFVVRVRDTRPPQLQRALPDEISAQCQDANGAVIEVPAVVWRDNGSSADDLETSLIVDPGENQRVFDELPETVSLLKGRHVLRYVATDQAGNTGQADLRVNITDAGVPSIEVVEAPDSGWLRPGQQVVLEVADGCAPADQELEFRVNPPPSSIERDGNRLTLTFQREGLYRLQIEVEDDDGNVGRENSVRFGIDGEGPVATLATPSQAGVDPDDEDSFTIFGRAAVIALSAGGAEQADGVASGIARVRVVLDPDGDSPRVVADHEFDGNGVPTQGRRSVAGVGCELEVRQVEGVNVRDGFCNGEAELDLRHIPVGVHVLEATATDFAGNSGSIRGVFVSSNLVEGIPRVITRLTAARQGAPAAVQQRVALAVGRLNEALDIADIVDDDSEFDTAVFLGGSLRKVQDAVILLVQAIGLAQGESRAAIRDATELLLTLAWSDATLLMADADARDRGGDPIFLRNAFTTDAQRTGQALDLVLENIENDAFNQAAANALIGFFHAKSAHTGWNMDWHFEPRPFELDRVMDEYTRARDILRGIVEELTLYARLADAPAEDTMVQVRDRLNRVVTVLTELVDDGFQVPGGDVGLTDEEYVSDALLKLREVANFSQTAGNQGAWTRNYQFAMMQVVRYMTEASIRDAIAVHGAGRNRWAIYVTGLSLIDRGVELLDERQVQAVIELYGQNLDAHCLIFATYHCDFISDEGARDTDRPIDADQIPAECADRMFGEDEWAEQPNRNRIRPQCQYFPDGDADDYRE